MASISAPDSTPGCRKAARSNPRAPCPALPPDRSGVPDVPADVADVPDIPADVPDFPDDAADVPADVPGGGAAILGARADLSPSAPSVTGGCRLG
jgi:hypothetical protein